MSLSLILNSRLISQTANAAAAIPLPWRASLGVMMLVICWLCIRLTYLNLLWVNQLAEHQSNSSTLEPQAFAPTLTCMMCVWLALSGFDAPERKWSVGNVIFDRRERNKIDPVAFGVSPALPMVF